MPDSDAIRFIEELAKRANSDAIDATWGAALQEMLAKGWRIVPPMDNVPEFPDGYRAELTGEHDGTGGEYVALYGPDGAEIDRRSGGGFDSEPFHQLAARARIHAEARRG